MLLMHALFVFLLSSSAMVAPVQGSDTEPPKPLETKQMFHFYGGGPLGYEASLFYMRKLHGFWRTAVVSKHSSFSYLMRTSHTTL
jgi:hypothetical protein